MTTGRRRRRAASAAWRRPCVLAEPRRPRPRCRSRCARPTTGWAASCAPRRSPACRRSTRAPTPSSPGCPDAAELAARARARQLTSPTAATAAVWHDGLHPIPEGAAARGASGIVRLARTGLLSLRGKLRAADRAAAPPPRRPRRLHRRARPQPVRRRGPRAARRRPRRQHLRRRHRPLQPGHGAPARRPGRPRPQPAARRPGAARADAAPPTGRCSSPRAPAWPRWPAPCREAATRRGVTIRPARRRSRRSQRDGGGWRVDGDASTPSCWPRRRRRPRRWSPAPRRRRPGCWRRWTTPGSCIVTLAVDDWPDAPARAQRLPRAQARAAHGHGGLVRLAEVGPLATGRRGEVLRVSLGRDGLPVDHLDDDELVDRAVAEVGGHLGLDLQPDGGAAVAAGPAAFPQYRPHHRDWLAGVAAAPPGRARSSRGPATAASACRPASPRRRTTAGTRRRRSRGRADRRWRWQTLGDATVPDGARGGCARCSPACGGGDGDEAAPPTAPATVAVRASWRPTTRHRRTTDDDYGAAHDDHQHDDDARPRRSPPTRRCHRSRSRSPPPPEDGTTEPRIELGRIEIPAIGVDAPLFEGIRLSHARLRARATGRARRCRASSATSSSPATASASNADFRHLDQLEPGDEVIISTLTGRHVYRVTGTEIVTPEAMWIVDQTDGHTGHPVRLPPAGLGARAHRRPPRAQRLMPRAALALGGGFLVALSLPPWGWWPLAFVGVALFELALGPAPRRRDAVLARVRRSAAAGWRWASAGCGS